MRRLLSRVAARVLAWDRRVRAVPSCERAVFAPNDSASWYPPLLIGASTLGDFASHTDGIRRALAVLERLDPDDYLRYIVSYCKEGIARYGDAWRYADIVTALVSTAHFLQPKSYLEIGVRRGRSAAVIAATCPDCEIVGFDSWQPDYAGMPNPGPEYVTRELDRLHYKGRLTLISGDSHHTVPRYFREHPDRYFDVITVDGDHTEAGAEQDLRDVLPRVKVGGVLIFDDIAHPEFPYLAQIWRRAVSGAHFDTWQFTGLGFGVALAVRRS